MKAEAEATVSARTIERNIYNNSKNDELYSENLELKVEKGTHRAELS